MPRRPVIGVSTYSTLAAWGVWQARATLVPEAYLEALLDAGSSPVLLPAGTDAADVLERVDGVVLIGGPDIDPGEYGAPRAAETQAADAARDKLEIALVRGAPSHRLPLLAICRGLEIVNVARGGTLHQHLPRIVGHEGHSPAPGIYGSTVVHVVPASKLAEILPPSLTVDCSHHQGIDQLGRNLVVSALADDGLIEAVEDAEVPFLIAVQWHPEIGKDESLFRSFVSAATERPTGGVAHV